MLGTRVVVKLEARYFRDDVALEDAYVDHKVSDRLRLQLGVNKKRFGMEYEQSRRERLTPERSFFYRKLEELGIVGRQLNLRLLTEPIDGLLVDVTAGTSGSRDGNALVRVARQHDSFGYGYWGLFEQRRVDKHYITVWAQRRLHLVPRRPLSRGRRIHLRR